MAAKVPAAGTVLPVLEKPRFTSTHILRWLAAQQNWDKIHFDQKYCHEVANLEAPVINGALKQHLIVQFLTNAVPGAWPWRIDYRFVAPDLVGHKLQVRGIVTSAETRGSHSFVSVQVEVFNLDRAQVTTSGSAVLIVSNDGQLMLDAIGVPEPQGMALDQAVSPSDPGTSAEISACLGMQIDARESDYPIDLSRLRLFSEAVMDMAPLHFDPASAKSSPWGEVVAPPLFPLHGLEAMPGAFPLSEEVRAMGREGVNEVGRNLSTRFHLDPAGGMNAGNRVQIHSLARAGERIRADSTLVGARRRLGKHGGDMMFFETLNRYMECGGRPLVTERQTAVVRLVGT